MSNSQPVSELRKSSLEKCRIERLIKRSEKTGFVEFLNPPKHRASSAAALFRIYLAVVVVPPAPLGQAD